MKKSGAKNQGAWFRANKAIQKLNGLGRVSLAEHWDALPSGDGAFNALLAYAAETGVDGALNVPETKADWLTIMANNGIPLQIWMGKLTTTTYAKVEGEYIPNYTVPIQDFGEEIRKSTRNFFFAMRQTVDVFNIVDGGVANPGGLPDATQGQ